MKKLLLVGLLTISALVFGDKVERIEGTVKGFSCPQSGKYCTLTLQRYGGITFEGDPDELQFENDLKIKVIRARAKRYQNRIGQQIIFQSGEAGLYRMDMDSNGVVTADHRGN